jgi:hypothetical protein
LGLPLEALQRGIGVAQSIYCLQLFLVQSKGVDPVGRSLNLIAESPFSIRDFVVVFHKVTILGFEMALPPLQLLNHICPAFLSSALSLLHNLL